MSEQHAMKIVVGWNGTDEGKDALRLGAELARLTSGPITVACVIEPGALPPELMRDRDAWVERFRGLFSGARHELGDLQFSVREAIEDAAEGLREIALEEGAELVVLGSTHRGLIGRVLPGTVAERLLADPPCAVAVAPRGYAGRPHAGLGLIGVGYDGSPEARAALTLAERLAEAAGDELRILSAAPEYVAGEIPLGPLEPLRQEAEQRVERALEAVEPGVPASGSVMAGDPAATLEEQGVALDLLVIGSRGRGPVKSRLFGSVSADVIRRTPCPVLVVPGPDA
jgi:nucleotide-binding universal stress UspA family protein